MTRSTLVNRSTSASCAAVLAVGAVGAVEVLGSGTGFTVGVADGRVVGEGVAGAGLGAGGVDDRVGVAGGVVGAGTVRGLVGRGLATTVRVVEAFFRVPGVADLWGAALEGAPGVISATAAAGPEVALADPLGRVSAAVDG